MRRLIYGKRYDTETAKKLAEWDNNKPDSESDHLHESLYRQKTTNGAYFLHGSGGAMTWCAKRVIDGYAGGEDIRPMSDDDAKNWVHERLTVYDYYRIFIEPEINSRRIVSLSLTPECHEKAKAMAEAKGKSLSAWFESIVMSI